jgi:hypothetical protein
VVTDASVTIFINKVNSASRNSPTTPNFIGKKDDNGDVKRRRTFQTP